MIKVALWFILCALGIVSGAKILAFVPVPSNSHQAVYRPLLRKLAQIGHDVTYYTPIPMDDRPPNLKMVLIPSDGILSNSKSLVSRAELFNSYWKNLMLINMISRVFESELGQDVVQELIASDEKFDLVMTSSCFGQYSLSTLSHKFGVPMVEVMPAGDPYWLLEAIRAPDNPSYMVGLFSPFSDKMTLWERFQNTIHWAMNRYVVYYLQISTQQELMDKYFKYPGWETRGSAFEMASQSAVYLVNSHYSAGYLYPKPPNVKEIGGINVVQNKSLPQNMKQFLDSAVDGAIYFSMGSVVKVSDFAGEGKVLKAFLNTFRKLKQKVIWKWENDQFPEPSPNILTAKWFPQQDILAHENVKVFITQGGMISIFESISRGVPLLGMPVFGDQYKNMRHATTYGYGIKIDFNNVTEESLQWALGELLDNPSYKQQAEKRARLFHDRPLSALDEAVYWVEFVLKNGNVLQSTASSLPFYSFYCLDVAAIFLTILIVAYLLIAKAIKVLFSIVRGKPSKNKRD